MSRNSKWSRKSKIVIFLAILVPIVIFTVIKLLRFSGSVYIGDTLSQNGFIEIKPPSMLLTPGTWVTILNTNPLHLSIVCTPENSLGLVDETKIRASSSADTAILSKLSNTFHFDAETLASLKGESKFTEVKNISFNLKNIRVIELPDDVVMQGLQKREPQCREAIRFRIDAKQPISMVKSVLIADVTYSLEFNRELESGTIADLKKRIALALDLRLGTGEDGANTLVGKNLIWGIREDPRLAKAGLGLPATGGIDNIPHILTGKGPITTISSEPKRRTFSQDETVVSFAVTPLQQSSTMSCWATVYTMMKSWKDKSLFPVPTMMTKLGTPWDDYYLKDTGLPAGKEKDFVKVAGLKTELPANYTIKSYVEMLKEHGPLWIITGDGISSHARLLVGIYGNSNAPGIKAYEETIFEFIDPLFGVYRYESGQEFSQKFESEARWLVDGKFDDVELRYQILHWP